MNFSNFVDSIVIEHSRIYFIRFNLLQNIHKTFYFFNQTFTFASSRNERVKEKRQKKTNLHFYIEIMEIIDIVPAIGSGMYLLCCTKSIFIQYCSLWQLFTKKLNHGLAFCYCLQFTRNAPNRILSFSYCSLPNPYCIIRLK